MLGQHVHQGLSLFLLNKTCRTFIELRFCSDMEKAMQSNAPQPTLPPQTLLQGKPYQRGADVQATWRKYGWVPPSEQKAKQ
jgi:hypothetical protein